MKNNCIKKAALRVSSWGSVGKSPK